MSNEYDIEIVTDQYGEANIDFYTQQASQIRSEHVLNSLKGLSIQLKATVRSLKGTIFSTANIFDFRKFAK